MSRQRALQWLGRADELDSETIAEIESIIDNPAEVNDRFGSDLRFGTSGIRGLVGAGTNRMNKYTVAKITTALANFIKRCDAENRLVVIGYDGRTTSKEFAQVVADVLHVNRIKPVLFDDMRPTPYVSLAIRELGAIAGVMITASHSPAEYNGYKVYWQDGGQITEEIAGFIQDEYDVLRGQIIPIPEIGFPAAGDMEGLDELYRQKIDAIMTDTSQDNRRNVKVVYSALEGVGATVVPQLLEHYGFDVELVECEIDPTFSGISGDAPSPELKDNFITSTMLAFDTQADLVILTDADCDRVGVAVRKDDDQFVVLTGNEVAAILVDYLIRTRRQLPREGYVVKTLVSDSLAADIASNYGFATLTVPTGFKYIAEQIRESKFNGTGEFFFGYEESCGYLYRDLIRDKDGIQSSLLIADAAAYWKANAEDARSLYQVLNDLYLQYGYRCTELLSFEMTEIESAIAMDMLRNMSRIAGLNRHIDTASLVRFEADHRRFWMAVRKSGTESKLKFYIGTRHHRKEEARRALDSIKTGVVNLLREEGFISESQHRATESV